MIANGPIAGHPIASPLLRRRGAAVEVVRGARGGGGRARILREDEEILAVIMAFTQCRRK